MSETGLAQRQCRRDCGRHGGSNYWTGGATNISGVGISQVDEQIEYVRNSTEVHIGNHFGTDRRSPRTLAVSAGDHLTGGATAVTMAEKQETRRGRWR